MYSFETKYPRPSVKRRSQFINELKPLSLPVNPRDLGSSFENRIGTRDSFAIPDPKARKIPSLEELRKRTIEREGVKVQLGPSTLALSLIHI